MSSNNYENRKINEQLDYEWETFYMTMKTTSRENIFAHAEEIVIKRRIYDFIKRKIDDGDYKEQELQRLFATNIIDGVYFSIKEEKALEFQKCEAQLFDAVVAAVDYLINKKEKFRH